ncbi:discoidin domain-containing receptor A-like isoform X2 [Hydractinia symbiolongicarpus]|uniref:discoidin domain-containing receptor A-like isoform X2 n=1 Tax=Hydractinia symbiolongicarpus TaxID=13093 RepID=UPI0025511480|nr:discoidin domain-containing receptor A-like isoform X2 [Hydractinia symbiolongicarpus]
MVTYLVKRLNAKSLTECFIHNRLPIIKDDYKQCILLENITENHYECTETNLGLVTKDLGKTFFTQSRFLAQQISFNAEHLPTNMQYAWCLKKDNISSPYEDWASVNLKAKHLIYGLHVDGFRDFFKPSDKYLPTFFKLQYSLDSKIWADYEGGKELQSLNYSLFSGKKLLFKVPLLGQYVRIRMKIERRTITCIKLQVYGCPAIKAPARIFHYKIYQGDSSSTYSWKDTKYPHNPTLKERFLSRETGCLTDGEHLKTISALTSNCWVGWNKTSRPKPLVALTLSAVSRIYAVKLLTYVNESMHAGTIKRFSVEAGRSVPIPRLGYVCAPDSMYYISPQVIEYTIDLGGVLAKVISIKFDYSMEWIFLRQVSIVQEIPVATGALKLSPKYLTCKTPAKPTKLDDKKEKLPYYLPWLSLPALLVVAVIVILMLHRRRTRRDKSKSSINEHYAGLKKYKNPTYTDLKENERQAYPDLQNHESPEYADLKKKERQDGAGLLEHDSPEYADLTMDVSYSYVDVKGKERHGYEDLQKHEKSNYVDLQKHEKPIYKNLQNHESSGCVNFREDENSTRKDLNRHESSNYEELNHDYEVEMPPDV